MQPEQSHRGQRQPPLGPQNPPQGLPTILSRGQISGLITYNRDPKTLQGRPLLWSSSRMAPGISKGRNIQARTDHGMVAKSH